MESELRGRAVGLVVAISFAHGLFGCGYRAVEATRRDERFYVGASKAGAVRSEVRREVELGLREELSKHGALLRGEGYPRAEYEVVDSLDEPTAIQARSSGPTAGGIRVRVRGRAWVRQSSEGTLERDTSDHVEEITVAADSTLLGSNAELRGAELSAARRLGQSLARSILGLPTAPTAD